MGLSTEKGYVVVKFTNNGKGEINIECRLAVIDRSLYQYVGDNVDL